MAVHDGAEAIADAPEPAERTRRVFSPQAAFIVSDILADRDARSTTFGLENPLATRFWTAVKTGTSKDMCDNWGVGYSQHFTVGVWVGNFSGDSMWEVSGVSDAAPVWLDLMNHLHRSQPSVASRPPEGVVLQELVTGGAPRRECFIRGTEAAGDDPALAAAPARIAYPPPGSVFAIDPDIPPESAGDRVSAPRLKFRELVSTLSIDGSTAWIYDQNGFLSQEWRCIWLRVQAWAS